VGAGSLKPDVSRGTFQLTLTGRGIRWHPRTQFSSITPLRTVCRDYSIPSMMYTSPQNQSPVRVPSSGYLLLLTVLRPVWHRNFYSQFGFSVNPNKTGISRQWRSLPCSSRLWFAA
jgi:hypothetical protein